MRVFFSLSLFGFRDGWQHQTSSSSGAEGPLQLLSPRAAAPPRHHRPRRGLRGAIGAEGAGTGLDPAQEREDLPLHSHLGNKHQEELNKHWKSLKSTDLSKSTFTFCSNRSERGVAGEAPALRWEHEDVLFWFAFILLSFFFFQEEKIAMATCATAELLGEWLQVRLATHQLTMLICQIYIVINVKRQSTI